MTDRTVKTIINVKSMATSPLTWKDYSKMVEYAIDNNVVDFIFSNDDIDYNYYVESRFFKMISIAKINVGIGGKTVDYIKNKIGIHYAINSLFPIEIDGLLEHLKQKTITSAYLEYSCEEAELMNSILRDIVDLKSKNKILQIGVLVSESEVIDMISNTKDIVDFDYLILKDESFISDLFFERLPRNIKIYYQSELYNEIFSLINLLYRADPILRTKLFEDVRLKKFLEEFLISYNFETFQNIMKYNKISGIVLNADNPEVLERMLSISGQERKLEIPVDLISYINYLKENDREGWWKS
ncbi:hypothetical protein Hs30E_07930 [Lactococcus hodotermopsidis]|uniref:Uncharacterized protein n=1 Tax=Pseudolactococcus hodotermopsidis TaxID=2709157 RepID=A0A6A0BA32_9LACT|nr:hypothetical protein [Lactococcus hodotermopsidis]GFH42242.1 hypothetical protein Hs30E_07930 [Lactococcus hodotermopsidis]